MATKKRPEPEQTEDAEAPQEPSDARAAFFRGEITWRELCEAEAS